MGSEGGRPHSPLAPVDVRRWNLFLPAALAVVTASGCARDPSGGEDDADPGCTEPGCPCETQADCDTPVPACVEGGCQSCKQYYGQVDACEGDSVCKEDGTVCEPIPLIPACDDAPSLTRTSGLAGGQLRVADLDGDGRDDLVVVGGSKIDVLMGPLDGAAQTAWENGETSLGRVVVGQMLGTNAPDLAVLDADFSLWTLEGDGSGAFSEAGVDTDVRSMVLAGGDLDGDGELELGIVLPAEDEYYPSGHALFVAEPGTLPHVFDRVWPSLDGGGIYFVHESAGITAGPFFDDGREQLMLLSTCGAVDCPIRLALLAFAGGEVADSTLPWASAPVELDGDASVELIQVEDRGETSRIERYDQAAGSFSLTSLQAVAASNLDVWAAGDVDGNGVADLAFASPGSLHVVYRTSDTDPGCVVSHETDVPAPQLLSGDFDGDGDAELAVASRDAAEVWGLGE